MTRSSRAAVFRRPPGTAHPFGKLPKPVPKPPTQPRAFTATSATAEAPSILPIHPPQYEPQSANHHLARATPIPNPLPLCHSSFDILSSYLIIHSSFPSP